MQPRNRDNRTQKEVMGPQGILVNINILVMLSCDLKVAMQASVLICHRQKACYIDSVRQLSVGTSGNHCLAMCQSSCQQDKKKNHDGLQVMWHHARQKKTKATATACAESIDQGTLVCMTLRPNLPRAFPESRCTVNSHQSFSDRIRPDMVPISR